MSYNEVDFAKSLSVRGLELIYKRVKKWQNLLLTLFIKPVKYKLRENKD